MPFDGVGGDEVVAAGDRVDDGRGGGRAEVDAAPGKREERGRAALGIADILQLDAGVLEVAQLIGELMRGDAALAGEVAQF